jgi:hypothetical protein
MKLAQLVRQALGEHREFLWRFADFAAGAEAGQFGAARLHQFIEIRKAA